jgi:tetratricopeptide (TPR) repeat protein
MRFACFVLAGVALLTVVWDAPRMCSPGFRTLLSAVALLVALPVASSAQLNSDPARPSAQPLTPVSTSRAARPVSLFAAEQLGDELMAQHRYQAALEMYSRVPAPSAKLWARMGVAYEMLFGFESAVRCYKESLRLDPDNARTINDMATALDQLGEHVQAEQLYRKALRQAPDSAIYLRNLGTNLLVQHQIEYGSEAYRQALALDPHIFDDQSNPAMMLTAAQNADVNYARARSCAQAGITNCALGYLRKALQENSEIGKRLAEDSDFAALRNDPSLQQLLASQK